MKAIMTKYHSPTYAKGSRISASDADGNRVYVSYESGLNSDGNHAAAVEALKAKMNWTGDVISGGWKRGQQIWVFVPGTFSSKGVKLA